jgi:hypothetical protein
MMKRLLTLAASALVLPALAPPLATADRVYHTEHLALTPVGGAPLRSGFVQNIKANGPIVYAHEIYVLNGATPLATYTVTNNFFVGDTTCKVKESLFAFDTASFRTNRAGNGRADVKIAPEDIGGLTGDHGVFWTLRNAADEVVYETACTTVTLD